MGLFELPKIQEKQESNGIKLKKGQTINDLIEEARRLVNSKLRSYKNETKIVTDIKDFKQFFEEVENDTEIAIDTETTGLDTFSVQIVGMSLCNEKGTNIYVPINHKSSLYNSKLSNQIPENELKEYCLYIIKNRNFKWILHNFKYDAKIFYHWLRDRDKYGNEKIHPMDIKCYADTMIASYLLAEEKDHSLKYLYNKYIDQDSPTAAHFDDLFKGITFDYIPIDLGGIYAR